MSHRGLHDPSVTVLLRWLFVAAAVLLTAAAPDVALRGLWLIALLAWAAAIHALPERVHLNRGNHEELRIGAGSIPRHPS